MLENDLVGVGVGPTNLSLASLIETARVSGLAHFQSKFLEKNRPSGGILASSSPEH
jgi:lysine/ornithine N-monooxygenase